MRKWNYEKQEYEGYEVPEDWYCPVYCNDMDEKINCSSCGAIITFGDAYTSSIIHNPCSFGYPVCCNCKQVETKEDMLHRKQ